MFGLALDAVVLICLVMALNYGDEAPSFLGAVLAALGIGVFTFGAVQVLAGFGLLGLLGALVAAAVLTGVIFLLCFGLQPGRAALGGVLFLVYKVVMNFVWISLLR